MFERNCPTCDRLVIYKTQLSFARAKDKCKSCCKQGIKFNAPRKSSPPTYGMKGKKHSEETKRKISDSLTKNLPNKFDRGLLSWWSVRNRMKTPFCEWCYSEDNLQAHHILSKSKFPQYAYDDDNCLVLCKACHKSCHKKQNFETKAGKVVYK